MKKKEKKRAGNFYYYLNENGEAVIAGAIEWPEILVIPEEIDGHPVTEIGNGAFDTDRKLYSDEDSYEESKIEHLWEPLDEEQFWREREAILSLDHQIKEVRLPDTIRIIGPCAFYQNFALGKINFPKGLKFIDGCAFTNTRLFKIRIPHSCELYHEEGLAVWQEQGAFEGCGGCDPEGYLSPDPAYSVEIEYF